MTRAPLQEPGMAKFYSPTYGFLHAVRKENVVWYNLTDVCRFLGHSLKVAEEWVKDAGCRIQEYNVKRAKITTCNRYVDGDGLSTIMIMCCRPSANGYRRWICNTVLFSMNNPEHTYAIPELDDKTLERMSAPEITDHYKQVAKQKPQETSSMTPAPNSKSMNAKKKAQKKSTMKSEVKTTKKCQAGVEKKFVPSGGHLTIEEWFRQEFPIREFLGYVDGMLSDNTKLMKQLPVDARWPIQHRINVMTVFRKMLKANEGNVKYAPTEERMACMREVDEPI